VKKKIISLFIVFAMLVSLMPPMSINISASVAVPTNLGRIVIQELVYSQATGNIAISWSIIGDTYGGVSLHSHPDAPFEIYIQTFGNDEFEHLATVEYNGKQSYTYNHSVNREVDFVVNYYEIRQYVGEYTVQHEIVNPHSGNPSTFSHRQTNLIVRSNTSHVIWSPVGVRWEDYTRKWEIADNNQLLGSINNHTLNNHYKLSVDLISAGIPQIHFNNQITRYSGALANANPAVFGIIPEIFYNRNLTLETMEIKFEIEDIWLDYLNDSHLSHHEFSGIRRLNIFKFYENINMFLPIETKFDDNKNIVYAEVTTVGTYGLIDMEIWLKILNVDTNRLIGISESGFVRPRNEMYLGTDWWLLNDLHAPLEINGQTSSAGGLTDWENVNACLLQEFWEKENTAPTNNIVTPANLPSIWYMMQWKGDCFPQRYIGINNGELFNILDEIKVLPTRGNPTTQFSSGGSRPIPPPQTVVTSVTSTTAMPPFTPAIANGNPTIGDALEILKLLAGLPNAIQDVGVKPTIGDALEVLKKLAGLPNVFDTMQN
jgi:hypothetical protein